MVPAAEAESPSSELAVMRFALQTLLEQVSSPLSVVVCRLLAKGLHAPMQQPAAAIVQRCPHFEILEPTLRLSCPLGILACSIFCACADAAVSCGVDVSIFRCCVESRLRQSQCMSVLSHWREIAAGVPALWGKRSSPGAATS